MINFITLFYTFAKKKFPILSMKKYLILFAILLCAQVVYSQDLIVTTTGDSLFCKIIDVSADEIQFRFGKSGNVISIRKDEAVYHKYNFTPASGSGASTGKRKNESSGAGGGLDLAVWSGVNTFGKISVGEVERGGAFVIGADVAYFFGQNIGAGVKFNIANSDVNLDERFLYFDRVMFIGPAVYSRFGKGKLSFAVNAGVGGLKWQLSDLSIDDVTKDDESATSIGAVLSAGVNFMITQHLGLGINLQSTLGTLKTSDYERNPMSIGGVLGINYRF